MKLTPYRNALKMGKAKMAQALAPIKAKRAEKQAELEMAKIDEVIATKEAEIHEECAKEDINFGRILDFQDSLALSARRKRQYQKILDEMFPPQEIKIT